MIEFIIGFIDGLLANLVTPRIQRFLQTSLPFHKKNTDENTLAYVDSFLATRRAPRWDEHLMDSGFVKHALIRVSESGDGIARRSDVPQKMLVSVFLDQLLLKSSFYRFTGKYGEHVKVFFVLGEAGSGKSTLALHLAEELAYRAKVSKDIPLPIYVNLRYFGGPFQPNTLGLNDLIHTSVVRHCPAVMDKSLDSREADSKAALVLTPPPGIRICYVLDSADEMPVSGNSEQERDERLAAIARFIDTHREHMFLITCREDEYGILRDQQATFKLLQFKLWPWTQKMFDDYLKIRLQETASLSRIRRTLSQADQSPEWQQFSRSALYASLLLDTYTGAGSQTGGELWDRFFQKHLKPHLADELEYDQVMADLSSLAFYATKYPDRTPPVSSHASRIGSAAGLLDQEGSQFRIRPFQQYFTARYLWHKIKTDPNTELLELEHPSVHLTFAFLAELAGSDPAFASYEKKYIDDLIRQQDIQRLAWGFELICHSLTADRLRANPELGNVLLQSLELLLRNGKAGQINSVVSGLGSAPELLTSEVRNKLDLRSRLLFGDAELQRQLFRVFVLSPRLILKLPSWFLSLVLQLMRNTRLMQETRSSIASALPLNSGTSQRWLWLLITLFLNGYVLCLFMVYWYSSYLLALLSARIEIRGMAAFLGTPWQYPILFPAVPRTLADAASRGVFISICVVFPWWKLRQQARAGIRFRSLSLRFIVLILLGSVIRFLGLLPVLGNAGLDRISASAEYLTIGLFFLTPLSMTFLTTWFIILFRGNLSDKGSTQEVPESGRWIPKPAPSAYKSAPPAPKSPKEKRSGAFIRYCGWLFGGIGVAAALAVVGFLLFNSLGRTAVFLIAVAGLLAGLIHVFLVKPIRSFRRALNTLERTAMDDFSNDFDVAVNGIRGLVLSPSTLNLIKRHYITLIAERVRWNTRIHAIFHELALNPHLSEELRTYLELVITQKEKEMRQNSNPFIRERRANA